MLWPCIHTLADAWPLLQLHLSAHSKVIQGVQQSTCKVYRHAQHIFLQFYHCYGLLPVPTDQETLFYFATFLANAKGLQHGTILSYLYGVWVLHINMGLSDPLKGILQLHKCLQAIHIQSKPASRKLAFMYKLLTLVHPLHRFPMQQVLWATLTMAHFSFLWMAKFTVDHESFNSTWHLCVQDVTPSLTTQAEIQYITVHLKVSKTDPFGQGINVIIGCLGTQVCSACATWVLIQSHWANTSLPNGTIFPAICPATLQRCDGGSHQRLLAKLGLNPSCYSGHSMHMGEQPQLLWPVWKTGRLSP